MSTQKLTKHQAIIITGFTGILCGEMSDFHADVEKRLGRGVQTFEFGIKSFMDELKGIYHDDFTKIATVEPEIQTQKASALEKEREAFIAKLRELKYFSHDSKLWNSKDNKFENCGIQTHWEMWLESAKSKQAEIDELKAKLEKAQAVPEGFVLVKTEKVKYFSHDGDNYEIHDTLAEAKHEAECAIEHFSERLADQLCDPRSDGNFQDVGYGVVLGQSSYSVDHIVTKEDVENGEYGYEAGTEIMSLFLIEAAQGEEE